MCNKHYLRWKRTGNTSSDRDYKSAVRIEDCILNDLEARIPLWGKGGIIKGWALIDREDLEWLYQWSWNLDNTTGYATRPVYLGGGKNNGKHRTISMHRQILGLSVGDRRYVDHINGDKLDNRKANLRIVTPQQSAQNTSPRRNSSSKYRGVTWRKEKNKWAAQAQLGGKNYYLGLFDSEIEAARVATEWRKKHMPFSVEHIC
jgi:hypothetical protein